jgi:sensor histidine kinase YesM
MLLIPFVENAFKHGNLIDGFLTVEVDIQLVNDKLNFSIKNTVLSVEEETDKNGIGLENIQKRLDLIYKDNYSLKTEIIDNWFCVNLIINT